MIGSKKFSKGEVYISGFDIKKYPLIQMCVKHLYQGCKVYDKGCKLFIVRGVNSLWSYVIILFNYSLP